MTWTIELPRLGSNRKYYTTEIKTKNTELVAKDEDLKNILSSSNVSFETFVASIRKVVENAYTDPRTRPPHINNLLRNTNWANHGARNTKFASTTVDVDHCDEMLALFTTFVDSYNPGDDDDDEDDDDGSSDDNVAAISGAMAATTVSGEVTCSSCTNTFKLPPNFRGKNPKCRDCR